MPTKEEIKEKARKALLRKKAEEALARKKAEEAANANNANNAVKSGTGKNTVNTNNKNDGKTYIDPYFEELSEDDLKNIFIIPSGDQRRGEDVKTQQGYDPANKVHGKNIDINKFRKNNTPYLAEFKKKYGVDFDYTNKKHIETYQKEFNDFAWKHTYDTAISKSYPKDLAEKIANVFVKSQGFQGEQGKDIRAVDKAFGEWTSSRFFPDLKPYTKKVSQTVDKTDTKIETKGLEVPQKYAGNVGKWWWQDRVQAFSDLMDRASIKKYYPQNFVQDVYIQNPTYYDPNRELSQQASIAGLGTRAARTIMDPQRFSDVFSNIQASAAEQAANTLGRYNNLNVGVANQFAGLQSNLLNAYSRALAQGKTNEANQLAILNQQYDNSLRQMRARQTANYKQAITNMAKTDVLNDMYPQYAVDPETGGMRPTFLRGKPFKPGKTKSVEDSVKEIRAIMDLDSTLSSDDAIKIWQYHNGLQSDDTASRPVNPHQYPQSNSWQGSYPVDTEEEDTGDEEENDGTAYNYDYWTNPNNMYDYNDTEGFEYDV